MIDEGRRNFRLAQLAGAMRSRGMGESEIANALREINERECDPPLDASEVVQIAASVARYAPAPTRWQGRINTAPRNYVLDHDFAFEEPEGYDRSIPPPCDVCGRWPGLHIPTGAVV